MINNILFFLTLIFLSACGVKGDPIPPKDPADMGRGQPTYKGATKELAIPVVPPVLTPEITNPNETKNKK